MMELQKSFIGFFLEDIKDTFMISLQKSKQLKQLCVSQRQAIIKLLEKPNKDKRYVANWRPISLSNFDLTLPGLTYFFTFWTEGGLGEPPPSKI